MAEHTNGPWHLGDADDPGTRWKVNGPEGWLGVAWALGDDEDEAQANARLIAAAPDLLFALEQYVNLDNRRHAGIRPTAGDWADCHGSAVRAIYKATGKGGGV